MMSDVDYTRWAYYIDGILKKNNAKKVYEAGCGTGRATIELCRLGYDITASDISGEMLKAAAHNARKAGCEARFVLADMRSIEVGNKADAVISICDGANYLDREGLLEFIRSAYLALREDGVLLFDISSKSKLESMDGQVFFDEREDASCIWQNTYDKISSVLTIDVTLYIRRGRLFERLSERHEQHAHDADFIKNIALSAGFKSAQARECFTGGEPSEDTQRIQFVCRR